MATTRALRVGIFCFDDVNELDLVGPYGVLSAWAERSPLRPEVRTVSVDGAGVRCAHGLRLLPDKAAEEVQQLHVLIHPGGPGTRTLAADPAHLAWLHQVRQNTPLLVGMCTGALVLAAAGVLSGRPVATHRDAFDELVGYDPTILADTEARYVDDGDVATSAGVSASMDLALHLVARLEDTTMAHKVAWHLHYDHDFNPGLTV
ncbi:MAG: DJ-1/PfpI family protein [Micrococcales bacterium]|nr:DJ-1/PfpI family protein [Micrococcales bacterium]MCL2667903.1 DJ-1/PfpI family protein [Micrococcales bacterium]